MESAKWSYSSMSLFQQCPKKYHHLRVIKDIVEPPSMQMRYGLDVHKAAEDYVRDGTPIPPAFAFMQEMLDALKNYEGEILCEYKMGLTRELEACDFNAENVWWRGIADYMAINRDKKKARVVDYKTGKNTYADTKQLELLALATFKHFPEVEVVDAGLLFVVHTAFIRSKYLTEEQETLWVKWLDQSQQLDEAFANDVWNPKQNFTCRGWCPVLKCAHNGRK
jgi:PD-(D/E)XK nuclease superfamily